MCQIQIVYSSYIVILNILRFLVSFEDEADISTTKNNIVLNIIVGVSVLVSCVIIMTIVVLTVTIMYKKRLKSGEIHV